MASRYDALGNDLRSRIARDVVLTFGDIEQKVGPLPASARRHRPWWGNHRHGHAQAGPGWMDAGWEVRNVDFSNETVHFHRVRHVEEEGGPKIMKITPEMRESWRVPTDDPVGFLDAVSDVMIDYFGNRDAGRDLPMFERKRVGTIPREFDLVSHDGLKVGHAKLATMGDGDRIATSKLAAISEIVWLLQRAPAQERFIVFGKDPLVAQAWLDRYGTHADDITFYFVHDDCEVEVLLPKATKAEPVVNDE